MISDTPRFLNIRHINSGKFSGYQPFLTVDSQTLTKPAISKSSPNALQRALKARNKLFAEQKMGPNRCFLQPMKLPTKEPYSSSGYAGIYKIHRQEKSGVWFESFDVRIIRIKDRKRTHKEFRTHSYRSDSQALKAAIRYADEQARAYNAVVKLYNKSVLLDVLRLADFEAINLQPKLHTLCGFDMDRWIACCR